MNPVGQRNVRDCIKQVMEEMGRYGISKERKQTQANYNFRGIDDVYDVLNGALCRAGLLMEPRVTKMERESQASKSGTAMTHVWLTVEYDLTSVDDGTSKTIAVIGEALDSSDKATGKAMSMAYKYACFQEFCIPVQGHSDESEQDNYQPAVQQAQAQPGVARAAAPPDDALEIELREAILNARTREELSAVAKRGNKAFKERALSTEAYTRVSADHAKATTQMMEKAS